MPIKISQHICGFCQTDHHDNCPSVIQNGDPEHLVKCPCECPASQRLRCLVCNNREEGEIRPDTYTCFDAASCIAEQRRKRQAALDRLYPNGQTTFYRATSTKTCKCDCGEKTSGGNFRPGHADKMVASVAKEVKAGGMTEDDAKEMLLHISEGLIKKLEARL